MSRNSALDKRRQDAVGRGLASSTSVYVARADNAEIWDEDGKRYIDFAGGIAVLNTGHRHPRIMAAVTRQMALYTHTAFTILPYAPYVALAERLNALAPMDGKAKTLFMTTGAEATENAIKIARAATGRHGVIAFHGAFHGRTLFACGMTGKVKPYKRGFGPLPADIYHLPFPTLIGGVTDQDTLDALASLFEFVVDPGAVAAMIVEPVQGEGGFNIASPTLLRALAQICARHGILFIADEVQTGIGRTGKMFAIEHSGVSPDLMTVAKSLAGGFPLSAVIGRADIMDRVEPSTLGSTFGGSPIALAAALAVLDVVEEDGLLARAQDVGTLLHDRFELWASQDMGIAHVRSLGAMVAFDVVDAGGGADREGARRLCADALDAGLILITCGQYGQAIRILVPLTASDAVIEEGLAMMEAVLRRRRDLQPNDVTAGVPA